MKKKYFAVLNSSDPNVGEIRIYGIIGAYWIKNSTASEFLETFQELEKKHSRINIRMNSGGGGVHDGLAIQNAIKKSSVDVHIYIDGIAYSMAAIIALSVKKENLHMARGSMMMIHSVSSGTQGNAKDHRKGALILDKYDSSLCSLISYRTGKTIEDVKAIYLDYEDHFFTAEEALAEGLVDSIEDYDAEAIPTNIHNMSHDEVAAWYSGDEDTPSESFMNMVLNRVKSILPNGVINSENQNNMFNKFGKLSDLAKTPVNDRTNEQFEAVNEQIQKAGIEGVTVVTDSYLEAIEAFEGENTTLKTEKVALEKVVSDKDARIAVLESEVKALGGKPATAPVNVVTDKTDDIGTGTKEVVDDFSTSVDAEYEAIYGSK